LPAATAPRQNLPACLTAAEFSLTDDKFVLELETGKTQTFILKVLQNDRGTGLKVVDWETTDPMTGTVFLPKANNRVVAYR
jgi:hypothetical protein